MDSWLYYDLYLTFLMQLRSSYDLQDPQRTLDYLDGMIEHYDNMQALNYDSEIGMVRAKILELGHRLIEKYQSSEGA